jgi:hypothetical protein
MTKKPTEKEFTKDIKDIGSFTFKYPTLVDELKSDSLAAKLLDGNPNPSLVANNIATMMSALEVAIVEAPEGFGLEELYTYDELKSVYDAYVEQVLAFRGDTADKEEGAGESAEP